MPTIALRCLPRPSRPRRRTTRTGSTRITTVAGISAAAATAAATHRSTARAARCSCRRRDSCTSSDRASRGTRRSSHLRGPTLCRRTQTTPSLRCRGARRRVARRTREASCLRRATRRQADRSELTISTFTYKLFRVSSWNYHLPAPGTRQTPSSRFWRAHPAQTAWDWTTAATAPARWRARRGPRAPQSPEGPAEARPT
mmetsp:Transcript_17132/g.53119  ORF Transcript_17132/g.53119 Transcript_17132/m.53119 type:complete len:200 (+) Transcript_17132:158-757(+)